MVPALARTRQGPVIHVDPSDERGRRLVAADGDLNPSSLELWRTALALHPWQRVIDVGANYGEMVVGVALPAGAEVTVFEPSPTLLPFLRQTLADAGLGEVEVRTEAVADRTGTARFRLDRAWSGMSSIDPGGEVDADRYLTLDVPVVSLTDVLGSSGRSTCVKVDVEGFESAVLIGAAAALAEIEHWAVMLEILHMPRGDLAAWAATYPTYLLDQRRRRLVRLPGGLVDLTAYMLASGWLYPQDCLMVSSAVARSLPAGAS